MLVHLCDLCDLTAVVYLAKFSVISCVTLVTGYMAVNTYEEKTGMTFSGLIHKYKIRTSYKLLPFIRGAR